MFGFKDDFSCLKFLMVESYIEILLIYCGRMYYFKFVCKGLDLMVSLIEGVRVVILFYCCLCKYY